MTSDLRDKALSILRMPDGHSPLSVHNAIVDIRRNAKPGDEDLLCSYLAYPDDMVVSAVLYALIHIYQPIPGLLNLLLGFASGDLRDTGEMPIQTQAVESLLLYSRKNPEAISKLLSVAKDAATSEAPRARAWKCLAELFGVPWQPEFTRRMIQDPESEQSRSLQDVILKAVDEHDSEDQTTPFR